MLSILSSVNVVMQIYKMTGCPLKHGSLKFRRIETYETLSYNFAMKI